MTIEKFKSEVKTLDKFFTKYCSDKHKNQYSKTYQLDYKESISKIELYLCENCHKLVSYSFERLKECPHINKPRCRKCPTPCYEKDQWKNLAKVMKYSSITLGLGKIKSRLFDF